MTTGTAIKVGRPREFDPEYCNLVRAIRSKGYSVSAFCSIVGISRDSYYRWKKEYPEFGEACDIAVDDNKYYFEDVGKKGMMGELKINAAIWKEMQDRQHGSVKGMETGSGKTEINIGNMNVLQNLTEEQLLKHIESKWKNLRIEDQIPHDGSDETITRISGIINGDGEAEEV